MQLLEFLEGGTLEAWMGHEPAHGGGSSGGGVSGGAAPPHGETPGGARGGALARRMAPSEALSVAAQVARALACLHAHDTNDDETPGIRSSRGGGGPGVAFLALAPRHVGLSANGSVAKLLDLTHCVRVGRSTQDGSPRGGDNGAAASAAAAVAGACSPSGQPPQSHLYLAPEVCKGQGCGASADVFSLSLLLWELTHGRRAFPPCTLDYYRNGVASGMNRPRVDLAVSASFCGQASSGSSAHGPTSALPELLRCCWRSHASLRPRASVVAAALDALARDTPPPPFTVANGWAPLPRAAEAPGALALPRHSGHNGSGCSGSTGGNQQQHAPAPLRKVPAGLAPALAAAAAVPRRFDMAPPPARTALDAPAAARLPIPVLEPASAPLPLPPLQGGQPAPNGDYRSYGCRGFLVAQHLGSALVAEATRRAYPPSSDDAAAYTARASADAAAADAAASLLGLATSGVGDLPENMPKKLRYAL